MRQSPTTNRYNQSHYRDPTAYDAVYNITEAAEHKPKPSSITKEQQQVSELINIIKQMLHFGGFELIGRIAIKSTKTQRIYR
ncbi:MAG: hypothetical protein RSH79_04840 [Clostridiales bacterium]